ncbi:hypothetical protein [Methanoculleus chikugoensis]|uniref:hypothetical protein n=1 Tax=Methanoculleus chikugoensis TaxID=118126 RepID=UPI001FB49344|nr:hypothetical protein [Methanoculleus chikugoensis]
MGEVPEVVERLREETYLAELLLHLPDFGFMVPRYPSLPAGRMRRPLRCSGRS